MNTEFEKKIIIALFRKNAGGGLFNCNTPLEFGELSSPFFPSGKTVDEIMENVVKVGFSTLHKDFYKTFFLAKWINKQNKELGVTTRCAGVLLSKDKSVSDWQEYITKNDLKI